MIRTLFRCALVVACLGLISAAAAAQDFERSYRLSAGGRINIRNISGNVEVAGYDGDAVVVSGYKEGRDRDLVEVEDTSGGNRVDLRARYPENCRCSASIRFRVQVPRSVNFDFDEIASISGGVEVSGVTGSLHAKSTSGRVMVRDVAGTINASSISGGVRVQNASGSVSAKSTSGNVEVEIVRLDGTQRMEFSSISGSVNVKLPANLDAEVEMSTVSGSLETEFPMTIEGQGAGRRSVRGRIGSGARTLRLSSVSGSISLRRS